MFHYRNGFERLEVEVIDVAGNDTVQTKPAVFSYPEDVEISGPELQKAVEGLEDMAAIDSFLDESDDDDGSFYYASGRVYRTEEEPDLMIKADNTSIRIFENPYDAEEPLPRLDFEEFKGIVQQLESALGVEFHEADTND